MWDLDPNSPTGVDNDAKNIDGDKFTDIRNRILEAYARGGVTTIGWHTTNPATGGTALGAAATLERLGTDASEAIAFGDGENDLSMFAAVGTSVAMGNARDTVKAAATYVTTAVDDDGIYNAAKHFGLM